MLSHLIWSLVVALVLIQVAVFATTIYLHRTATHSALVLHPAVAWMFRFALWLTTGLETKEWVAVHRKHHAFTDEEGDPHSPKLKGFWSVQLGNVYHYVKETKKIEVLERYARDIKESWWDRRLFRHGIVGLVIGTSFLCAIFWLWWGPTGILWALGAAGLHAVVYTFGLSSSINGLCHYIGYKNFDNTATNIRILGILAGGEGLHNNHHGFPRSPKFSWRSGNRIEIDPAWPVIRLMLLLRMAKHPSKTIDEMQGLPEHTEAVW